MMKKGNKRWSITWSPIGLTLLKDEAAGYEESKQPEVKDALVLVGAAERKDPGGETKSVARWSRNKVLVPWSMSSWSKECSGTFL